MTKFLSLQLSSTSSVPKTSPPVGLKRVYNIQSPRVLQKVKQLISPKLPTTKSAPPRSKSSRTRYIYTSLFLF